MGVGMTILRHIAFLLSLICNNTTIWLILRPVFKPRFKLKVPKMFYGYKNQNNMLFIVNNYL